MNLFELQDNGGENSFQSWWKSSSSRKVKLMQSFVEENVVIIVVIHVAFVNSKFLLTNYCVFVVSLHQAS
jgi:hypothetical protein